MNLYYHKSDFGVNSKWMFFAISHKKKALGWCGWHCKEKQNHILHAVDMYTFCSGTVK